MKKYKPQHARLLFIDRCIHEKSYPNCRSLAAEYEVSVKTIQRDIEVKDNNGFRGQGNLHVFRSFFSGPGEKSMRGPGRIG